mmetsp:Transcript_11579/g.22785  ORF Transcript_11579/g.22785 Transcript_11579/m.22785 type:complete len:92 (-) Transcript_11579:56-331(-)
MRKRAPGVCSAQVSNGNEPLLKDAHHLQLDFEEHLVRWGYDTTPDDAADMFQRRYALKSKKQAQGAIIDLLLQRSSLVKAAVSSASESDSD